MLQKDFGLENSSSPRSVAINVLQSQWLAVSKETLEEPLKSGNLEMFRLVDLSPSFG